MRKRTIVGLAVLAIAAGLATGESLYRSDICRDAIGRIFGRGRLIALVNGTGIYEIDLERETNANLDAAGHVSSEASRSFDPRSRSEALARLVANEDLREISKNEEVSEAELKREFDLLSFQFASEKAWTNARRNSGIYFLREQLRADVRARKWLEHRIASEVTADDESCRRFYAAHPEDFAEALRLRASHLFLAAPADAPPEVVDGKRQIIDAMAARIGQGEDFSQLVAEASEDEATKLRGGDLDYFSWWRMPAEFFAAVAKLRVGEIGKPFQSHLGFHLVCLTEIKPSRVMSFEEARAEIIHLLMNQHRQGAVQELANQMSSRAIYFP